MTMGDDGCVSKPKKVQHSLSPVPPTQEELERTDDVEYPTARLVFLGAGSSSGIPTLSCLTNRESMKRNRVCVCERERERKRGRREGEEREGGRREGGEREERGRREGGRKRGSEEARKREEGLAHCLSLSIYHTHTLSLSLSLALSLYLVPRRLIAADPPCRVCHEANDNPQSKNHRGNPSLLIQLCGELPSHARRR